MMIDLQVLAAYAQILSLFVAVISLLLTLPPAANRPPVRRIRRLLPYVAVATLSFLIGTIVGRFAPLPQEWSTSVVDGDLVSFDTTVTVRHPEQIEGDIWLVTQQESAKFFPAPLAMYPNEDCRVVLPSTSGTQFDIHVYFGGPQDYNKRFKLLTVVADKQASQYFIDTLKTWCRDNNYAGLDNLPSGVTIKRQVALQRKGGP